MKPLTFASLSSDRPTFFATLLVLFWVVAIGTGASTPYGWAVDSHGTPVDADYVGFYTAGKFALQGQPGSAYDWAASFSAQHDLLQNSSTGYYPWPYPPAFLMIVAAFAALPYAASMLTWTCVTLSLFAAALSRIATSKRDMLVMLAAPAVWLNMYVGQNGALSAALTGFALIFLPTRPLMAGLFIGLLSFKPHLGLLLPFALLAGRHYKAFATAGMTTIGLAASATAVFGTEPWLAFPQQLSRVANHLASDETALVMQSIFGVGRNLGLDAGHALFLQAMAAAALALSMAWLWRRRDVPHDLKAAALATAMTLASPYQFVYDLTILTIAQAFLLRHLARSGLSAGRTEIYGLLFANLLVFHACTTSFPFGIVASVVVSVLIAREVARNIGYTPEAGALAAA